MDSIAQRATKSKPFKPTFVFLPRDVLFNPPVRSQHEEPALGLSVFEFGLLAAILAYARNADSTTVIVSHRALLYASSMVSSGRSKPQVGVALERLCRDTNAAFPPLLASAERVSRCKVKLQINPWWLPSGKYARVLMPFPTEGSIVLALFLFSQSIEPERARGASTLAQLTQRLRLPSRPSVARPALDAALAVVNGFRDIHAAPPLQFEETKNGTIKITTPPGSKAKATGTGEAKGARRRGRWAGTQSAR
jgi:hypothetical protein